MDLIFKLTFLILMFSSFLVDRNMLKQEMTKVKIVYGVIAFVTLGLFVADFMHWNIQMPSRFFIRTVSPWVCKLIGI